MVATDALVEAAQDGHRPLLQRPIRSVLKLPRVALGGVGLRELVADRLDRFEPWGLSSTMSIAPRRRRPYIAAASVCPTESSVGLWRMRSHRTAPIVADMELTRELEQSHWKSFLEDVSGEFPTSDIRIDIISPALGDEVEAAGLLLHAMSYDPRTDEFEVVAGRGTARDTALVHHRVEHPQHIWVDSRAGILPSSIAVDAEDGTRTLVRIAPAPTLTS